MTAGCFRYRDYYKIKKDYYNKEQKLRNHIQSIIIGEIIAFIIFITTNLSMFWMVIVIVSLVGFTFYEAWMIWTFVMIMLDHTYYSTAKLDTSWNDNINNNNPYQQHSFSYQNNVLYVNQIDEQRINSIQNNYHSNQSYHHIHQYPSSSIPSPTRQLQRINNHNYTSSPTKQVRFNQFDIDRKNKSNAGLNKARFIDHDNKQITSNKSRAHYSGDMNIFNPYPRRAHYDGPKVVWKKLVSFDQLHTVSNQHHLKYIYVPVKVPQQPCFCNTRFGENKDQETDSISMIVNV